MRREVRGSCVNCGLPCLGSACPYMHDIIIFCDRCGKEIKDSHFIDGEEVCFDCYMEVLEDDDV